MKIKKTRIKQLLKLSLLKLRVYEQFTNKTKLNGFVDSNLNQIIVNIKKVLQIIFQYHKAEKRVLQNLKQDSKDPIEAGQKN